nr:MAG: hypothetical protein [Bacteriophage sp.]
MSEPKKTIQLRVSADDMLKATMLAFMGVMESNGATPVIISLGQCGTVAFELSAYDVDRWQLADKVEPLDIELDDPVIYEQLDLFH